MRLSKTGIGFLGFLLALWPAAGATPAVGAHAVADAVQQGDGVALRALLKEHANVTAPQEDGTTALHWAVRSGDKATVSLLLAAGPVPWRPTAMASNPCRWPR